MKKWICGVLSLMIVLVSAFALADARMPINRGALTDDADVLSSELSSAIVGYAEDVKNETDMDVYVAVVHFLDGLDAQSYANQLFKEWELNDNAVLLLCAAGEDSFATAMGKKAENKLSKQNMDNLMYTSSDFAASIGRQEYDGAFAKYFVAFNDLINKRFDASLKLPKAISKAADAGTAEEVQPGVTSSFSAGSLWSQIISGVPEFENGSSVLIPGMWSQTVQDVEDNSSYYTDYYQDHSYGENGIGVGGWIILIILVMIIFSQSHPVRRANNRYKKNHGGKGWIYGLLGVALIRMFRRR